VIGTALKKSLKIVALRFSRLQHDPFNKLANDVKVVG